MFFFSPFNTNQLRAHWWNNESLEWVDNLIDLTMDPSLPVTSKYLQVSEFIKNVSRLQTHGANIHIWETQLKDSIRVTTGIEDYLAVPMTREDDIIMDGWVLSMIECSIDEELLETIEFNLTAYDAFRTLILHFNPPNRARHLSIWAEIIHRHQFYHESAVHHINFIRKCLQNLSASKFVWTKDYFLGIMYQAGLPSDSTRSVDRVNLLIQSSIYLLAYPPHISSIIREAISDTERQINARITDALKSSPKPETGHQPRSNLMSLPEEILESLIEHVGAVSVKHTWTIRDQQWSRLTQYTTEDLPRPGWIYPPNPTPLLTSVQALSAVNSTCLRLCNKSLWKVSHLWNLVRFVRKYWYDSTQYAASEPSLSNPTPISNHSLDGHPLTQIWSIGQVFGHKPLLRLVQATRSGDERLYLWQHPFSGQRALSSPLPPWSERYPHYTPQRRQDTFTLSFNPKAMVKMSGQFLPRPWGWRPGGTSHSSFQDNLEHHPTPTSRALRRWPSPDHWQLPQSTFTTIAFVGVTCAL